MARRIDNKMVAFLCTDGVEQVELDQPWQAVVEAGGRPVLIGLHDGEIQAFNEWDKADTKQVDIPIDNANPADFEALVLPGGVINGDLIRADSRAVQFVQSMVTSGKPVGVICHGTWVLAEADVVRGRTITSFPSLQTDLRNAGANWVDQEVVVDKGLVSSRYSSDLPAFCAKLIEEISEGIHNRPRASEQKLAAGS